MVSNEFEAFLRMVFDTAFTETPFNVRVPDVALLLPIVNALVLAEVTSIAPIDKLTVPIFMPAVVAVPEF